MLKYLVLAHALFAAHTALAASPQTEHAAAPSKQPIAADTERYLHSLLSSTLTGDDLLSAYDIHYDSLPYQAQMKEKIKYPPQVYADLLEHRKHKDFSP